VCRCGWENHRHERCTSCGHGRHRITRHYSQVKRDLQRSRRVGDLESKHRCIVHHAINTYLGHVEQREELGYKVEGQFLCPSSEPSKIELVRSPACRRYLPLGNGIMSIHSPHHVPSSTPAELTQKQHLQLVVRLPEPAQRIQDGRQNRLPCNVSDPIWGRVCKHGLFVIVCKSTRLVLDGFKATQMRRGAE
jgi:hypothetical protein